MKLILREKGVQYKKNTGLTQTCPSNPLIEANEEWSRQTEGGESRTERGRGGGEEGILSAPLIARCAESTAAECGHCGYRKKKDAISHTKPLFFKICCKTTIT